MADPEQQPRPSTVNTTSSTPSESFSSSASIAYDKGFLRTPQGILLIAEIVLGMLVWALIAGTEYFRYPGFGWVMFIAVCYWVLSVFFLILYITMAYTRITHVPWATVDLCFNASAFILYFISAIVNACSITREKPHGNHNYNSWAASTFFAFLVTLCYGAHTYFNFMTWRSRT